MPLISRIAGDISKDDWERESKKRIPWIARHPEYWEALEAFRLAKSQGDDQKILETWIAVEAKASELWERCLPEGESGAGQR